MLIFCIIFTHTSTFFLSLFNFTHLSNDYFQFKQFTIRQERCAMKVTTDSCLFGAIVAKEISSFGTVNILDVGAGTGLLSLMVAQQNTDALMDAIEIDEAAAQQADENVAASPWAERIKIINGDILEFKPANLYKIIISNPPFYENQLVSPELNRQHAHHSTGLTLQQLFQQVKRLLKPDGSFFVLLPYYRMEEVISIGKEFNIYPQKHWLISQTPKHHFFRSILCFSLPFLSDHQSVNICIEDQRNVYSTAFSELLKPYYLKL